VQTPIGGRCQQMRIIDKGDVVTYEDVFLEATPSQVCSQPQAHVVRDRWLNEAI
jgi:hypothetical protein